MLVKLNEEGLRIFGWGKDREVSNFSNDRAYALMSGGYAAPDNGFMALYRANNPNIQEAEDAKAEAEAKVEAEEAEANVDPDPEPDEGPGDGVIQGVGSDGGVVVNGTKKAGRPKKT